MPSCRRPKAARRSGRGGSSASGQDEPKAPSPATRYFPFRVVMESTYGSSEVFRPEGDLPGKLTREDFLKVAGAGTAGVAALGASAALGSRYEEYLPRGGSKVNVILVIVDSLRRDHVGAYGNPWIKTPNLDALAKESLRFSRAYPESIPTLCARRAIHTGIRTWPFRNWVPPKGEDIILQGWEPIPNYQTTLAEMLSAAG